MNFKLIVGIVAVTGWMALRAIAQVTVSTTATTAVLQEPYSVVEDSSGNVFISDSANDRIVRIDAVTAAASVLAGVTGVRGSNDGAVTGPNPAHFFNPQGLLVVSIGGTNGLLVADSGNNLIRFIRFSDGYVSTLAGQNVVYNGTTNEIGANATFNEPVGLDQDPTGNVYIADVFQNTIRVINLHDPRFGVTNLVFLDGTTFRHPNALAFTGSNQLWVADSQNNAVKLITLASPTSGSLMTYLGGNSSRAAGTNDALFGPFARLNNPSGLLWIPGVGLLVSDTGNNSLRLATNNPAYGVTNYALSTYAGIPGTAGAANGTALLATFYQPEGLCLDPDNGAFLVADLRNNTIRSLQYTAPFPHVPSGLAATASYGTVILTWNPSLNATNYNVKRSPASGGPYALVGNDSSTNFMDSTVSAGVTYYYVVSAVNAGGESANSAEVSLTPPLPLFNTPQGLAFDPLNNSLFIADYGSNTIHLLDLNDNSTTTFLTPTNGILHPAAVLVDANDNVYVLNQNMGTNGSILEFDPYGNLLATNLTGLNQPTAFTMDGNGNIFITERAGAIKVLLPSGGISTIITLTTNLVTLSTNVQLQGIAAFDDGVLAVSDSANQVIWTVNPITKLVVKLTGQLGSMGSTLGASNLALLNQPHQLARAGNNQLVIADSGNNRLVTAARSGAITNVLASTNSLLWLGFSTDPAVGNTVAMTGPVGVAVSAAGQVFDSEPTNALVRSLTGTVTTPPPTPAIVDLPYFAAPQGLAFDSLNNYLFIADYANNAVQRLNLHNNSTAAFLPPSAGILHPVSVLVDTNHNVYVLNQNAGTNGSILEFDVAGNAYGPIVTGLDQPTAFTMDGYGTLFITEQAGNIRAFGSGVSNLVATITNANASLQGIALFDDGTIAVSDAGNQVIWTVNPITKFVSQLTGQLGASGSAVGASSFASLSQPHQLLRVGGNQLVAADAGNNRLVLIQRDGTVVTNNATYPLNASVGNIWFGQAGDPVASGTPRFVPMVSPIGLALGTGGQIFASETYYADVRGLTGTGLTSPTFNPGVSLPYFAAPQGLAFDNLNHSLFIADSANNAVERLNLNDNSTAAFLTAADGISHPASVLTDTNDNVYVLNQNAGTNGAILEFDPYGDLLATNLTGLNQPTAFTLDGNGNIFITELAGAVKVLFPSGASNTIVTLTTNLIPLSTSVQLQGIAAFDDGVLALSDSANQVIWTLNPITKLVSQLTGQLGTPGNTLGASNWALLNQPHQLARAGNNQLVIADAGNNRLVTATRSGAITNVLVSTNSLLWLGRPTDPAPGTTVALSGPVGVAVSSSGQVFDSEPAAALVRGLTATVATPPAIPPMVDLPHFAAPQGLAFDSLDNILFIADYTNNAVQRLDLNDNSTTTFLSQANGLLNPVSVQLDTNNNVYVLNQGASGHGYLLKFDSYGNAYGPIVTGLHQPTAFTLDGYDRLFVTEQAGNICAFGAGVSNIVATITNANVSLQGIALFDDGAIAVSDAGNNVLWIVNPITKLITALTGQSGTNAAVGSPNFASVSQPQQLVRVGGNQLVAADSGNNRLVLVQRDGTIVTNNSILQLNSAVGDIWFGQTGDPVASGSPRFVPMVSPFGVAAGPAGEIFASETYYDDIRGLTGTGISSPTFNPGVPLPYYVNPTGIALNNEGTVLYVTDPTNNTVSALNLANNQTTILLNSSSGIYQPVDVASDSSDNLYVLNQGTRGNGSIMEFDQFGNFLGTNATSLTLPTAIKLDSNGAIFVTELNGLVQAFNGTNSNTLANITTNANVRLEGIAVLDNGSVVVSDAGNQVLWKIPSGAIHANAVLFAGVLGVSGTNFGGVGDAKLNQPMRLATAFGGLLLIADSGNNRVVVADDSGTVSQALNSTNATLWFGLPIDPVTPGSPNFLPMLTPVGLAIGPGTPTNAIVYTSENVYKNIRGTISPGVLPVIPPPPAPLNLEATVTYNQVTLAWSPALSATNYNVLRSSTSGGPYFPVGTTNSTTFTDNAPGGSTNYYVVSAVNAGGTSPNTAEALAVPLIPPPPAPVIGWFDYAPTTRLHPVVIGTYNNDLLLGIDPGTNNVLTFYTTDGTTPSLTNGSSPYYYANGLAYAQPLSVTTSNELTITAINIDSTGQPSPITTATFLFQVANPVITGNNAGQFTLSDLTTNALLYYTVDGSNPTLGPPSVGPIALNSSNSAILSLQISSNTLFKVSAYRPGYSPSGIALQSFSTSSFLANIISLGFASGEASSAFIASPGQTFYAPVTLSVLPNTSIYSLQFDLTVTNAGPTSVTNTVTTTITNTASLTIVTNTGPTTVTNAGPTIVITTNTISTTNTVPDPVHNTATTTITNTLTTIATTTVNNAVNNTVTTTVSTTVSTSIAIAVTSFPNPGPAITPGAFSFQSMLKQLSPTAPGGYGTIPPYMFIGNDTGPLDPNQIVPYLGTNFVNLLTTDPALNLLGVGWLERIGQTNLYITTAQDLIQFSQAHDDVFLQAQGRVIVGGYAFVVPTNTLNNQTYQLQISRPSATSDGIGAPGHDVYIAAPTNGSAAGGAPINALEYVTVGQIKYIAGSVYPFRWFNAGDFGSSNIVNADVEQVFQSAIYGANSPPMGSDFFDAMDSCGNLGFLDNDPAATNFGLLTNACFTNATLSLSNNPPQTSPLFSGDDTTINQIAFGDGNLDVCDVYVTFRRSLDPSLTWFRRFWNNGQRVADTGATNVAAHASKSPASRSQVTSKAQDASTVAPLVNFSAGDIIGGAGQTVNIPIYASIIGSYPLRVLMLNLSVVPLDGSPALTSPVGFTQIAATLGTPYTTTSDGNANFAAAWLNSTNNGLTGTATLGTLSVTLPATASSTAAYAIHFDHASASPNGLGSFPNTKLTALLTTTARTNSTYGDGIPDAWRLRWFGTINNVLSASNACPSGDGVPNWQKFVAGVDPNVANDFPSLNPKTPVPSGSTTAIHWPSVNGVQYVVERANCLFGNSWTVLSTNTGTGGDMEFDDTNTDTVRFYRVEILP